MEAIAEEKDPRIYYIKNLKEDMISYEGTENGRFSEKNEILSTKSINSVVDTDPSAHEFYEISVDTSVNGYSLFRTDGTDLCSSKENYNEKVQSVNGELYDEHSHSNGPQTNASVQNSEDIEDTTNSCQQKNHLIVPYETFHDTSSTESSKLTQISSLSLQNDDGVVENINDNSTMDEMEESKMHNSTMALMTNVNSQEGNFLVVADKTSIDDTQTCQDENSRVVVTEHKIESVDVVKTTLPASTMLIASERVKDEEVENKGDQGSCHDSVTRTETVTSTNDMELRECHDNLSDKEIYQCKEMVSPVENLGLMQGEGNNDKSSIFSISKQEHYTTENIGEHLFCQEFQNSSEVEVNEPGSRTSLDKFDFFCNLSKGIQESNTKEVIKTDENEIHSNKLGETQGQIQESIDREKNTSSPNSKEKLSMKSPNADLAPGKPQGDSTLQEDEFEDDTTHDSYDCDEVFMFSKRLPSPVSFSCPLLDSWNEHSEDDFDFQQSTPAFTGNKREMSLMGGSFSSYDDPNSSPEHDTTHPETLRRPLGNLFAEDSSNSECGEDSSHEHTSEQVVTNSTVPAVIKSSKFTNTDAQKEKPKIRSYFKLCICLPAVH